MAGGEERGDRGLLEVAATYSRSRYWTASTGEVLRGGCFILHLRRFTWQRGFGATIEEALMDLAATLRWWVESFDEYDPPEDYPAEPPVVGPVRDALRRGGLLEELRAGVSEPVLDPVDEASVEPPPSPPRPP